MYIDRQKRINDIIGEVQTLFYGPSIMNAQLFDLYQDDIKRMLYKASNSKFFKVLDTRLVRYSFHNEYRMISENNYSPEDFVNYLLSSYVDYENSGNNVYRHMAQYIEKTYIMRLDLSNDRTLNYLIHCYQQAIGRLQLSSKYAKDDIIEFRRLIIYLISYLYMNDELLGDDALNIIHNQFFYKVLDVISSDDYYESMKLNGALNQNSKEVEDTAKIFYIEEAIKEVQSKLKEGELV